MNKVQLLGMIEDAKYTLMGAGTQADLKNGLKKAIRPINGVWGRVPELSQFNDTFRGMEGGVSSLIRANYEGQPSALRDAIKGARIALLEVVEELYKTVVDLDMETAPVKKLSTNSTSRGIVLGEDNCDPKDLARRYLTSAHAVEFIDSGRVSIKAWVEETFPEVGLNTQIDYAVKRIAGVINAASTKK